jgi:TRAP-type uncharacterized transport system fused permease subunit
MLLNTLTFYLIAAGFSLAIFAIMLAFARLQPGTLATRSCAGAIMVFAVAFLGSGFGPYLPRWTTVMGTNMLFIAALVMLHAGFAAYCLERKATPDWFGWALVAATALPFWYWGLVEPNGHHRSAVFSLAAFLVVIRTGRISFKAAQRQSRNLPLRIVAAIFILSALWMAIRFVISISAEAPPPELRGSNPTTWVTVFWFIVTVSVMAIAVMWLDATRKNDQSVIDHTGAPSQPGQPDLFRNRRFLLWGGTLILVFVP